MLVRLCTHQLISKVEFNNLHIDDKGSKNLSNTHVTQLFHFKEHQVINSTLKRVYMFKIKRVN